MSENTTTPSVFDQKGEIFLSERELSDKHMGVKRQVNPTGEAYKEYVRQALEETLIGHYIFQWTMTQHRYIGPFDHQVAAINWVYKFDPDQLEIRWVWKYMSAKDAAQPPKVDKISYWDETLPNLTEARDYFVMLYTNLPVFIGTFATKAEAVAWGLGWQRGKDDEDLHWQVRHLIGLDLTKPIEIVSPNTPDIQPLVGE